MPPDYLLDTNVVSYFMRGTFQALRKHFMSIAAESMAVSVITEGELISWIMRRPGNERIRTSVEDILARVPSLAWDSRAARVNAAHHEEQKRKGKSLSTEDLMIAAHALALDLTLVTHDAAFAQVDGLRREDWTIQ